MQDAYEDRRLLVEEAFETHARALLSFLNRLVRDVDEAETLAQECFVRLLSSDAEFASPEALRGWLYRVARNLCLDHFKKHRPQLLDPEESRRLEEESSTEQGPLDEVLGVERGELLQRALERLPEHYRITLVLRLVEGVDYSQLASIEEVTESALRTRVCKGLRLLREQLSYYLEEGEDSGDGAEAADNRSGKSL